MAISLGPITPVFGKGKVWRVVLEGGDGDSNGGADVDVEVGVNVPVFGARGFAVRNIPVPVAQMLGVGAQAVGVALSLVPEPARSFVRRGLGVVKGILP